MKLFNWLRKNKKGQSATEYMLIIAVIVLGLLFAAKPFVEKFKGAVENVGNKVEDELNTYTEQ